MTLSVVFDFLRQHSQLKAIRLDSRQVRHGDLFIAMPGSSTDGRQFIQQAINNGAEAIIAESLGLVTEINVKVPLLLAANLKQHIATIATFFYKDPSHSLKIIGITGTNGKTSTSHYIAQLLNLQSEKCGIMGTLGNGFLDSLLDSQLTTSDCCTIQDQLSTFVKLQTRFVAMEVSSIGLIENRLQNTKINTAVFTNLSQDHLDYHGDMEQYFIAKSKLFTDFAPEYCVVNLDDPYSERLLALIPQQSRVVTYSLLDSNADVYCNGNVVTTPWGSSKLVTSLIGKFNVSNVLAALSCCALQNIPLQKLLDSAQHLKPVNGRMQIVSHNIVTDPKVIVDYAHTPEAVEKALQALQEYKINKIYCIIGCGGDRDRSKRPLMLQAAVKHSDVVIITQDNPRTEDPQQIINDMLNGAPLHENVIVQMDRATAISQTIAQATEHDLILIAGKGHEDYQIIGTVKVPFSDVLTASLALEARR